MPDKALYKMFKFTEHIARVVLWSGEFELG